VKSGHAAIVILTGLTAGFVVAASAVRERHDMDARRTVVRRAVAESVGMCTLALSCEGAYTRDPLEGPAACMEDVPGGYCLYDVYDVVACPGSIGRPFIINIVRGVR